MQDTAVCLIVHFKYQSPKCKFLHTVWLLQTPDELEIIHSVNQH